MTIDSLYNFQSAQLLIAALTHKSFANELKAAQPTATEGIEHNEKLEFLGDAVLNMILSARLMRELPEENEGGLSKRRASLVNEERLAVIASQIGLKERLKLGKGEIKTGGADKPRILACGLEALIGAVFTDGGFTEAERVVNTIFDPEIARLRDSTLDFERDYKTRLQEWAHENKDATPTYETIEEFGPPHSRNFRVRASVTVKGVVEALAVGMGKSKKAAEQDAARLALEAMTLKTDEAVTNQNEDPSAE